MVSVTIRANPCLSLKVLNAKVRSHNRSVVKAVTWSPGNQACSFIQWKSCLTCETIAGEREQVGVGPIFLRVLCQSSSKQKDPLRLLQFRTQPLFFTLTSPHVAPGKEFLSSSGQNKGRTVVCCLGNGLFFLTTPGPSVAAPERNNAAAHL